MMMMMMMLRLRTSLRTYLPKHASTRSFSSEVKMADCHFQPKPYKGASYEDAVKARKLFVNPGLLTVFNKPLLMHQGHMQWVWDHTGKRYLDMAAGIVTISVGHCHPKLVKALGDQNLTLWHSPSIFLNPATIEYVEKLAAKMPGDLKAVYLTNSGTEANDLAIYMTRLYTGRFDILSLQNAYHGNSPHLMGTTAMSTWRHNVPSGFGMHQFMVPDVYRGPWGGSRCRDSPVQTTRSCSCQEGKCEANEKYLEQLDNVIKFSLPKVGLAGAIIESIQGAGGAVQFPKDFVKRAFELIRSKGGLCISDEVQTGFGRTGTHFWGFEGHGVVPDMVTMAKGIGNGFPLAAVITTHEIAKPLSTALHFNTFGGDPLACVAGSAVLDVLEEDKLQENAKVVGTYLLEELAKLREENKFVGDVRGKGLMVGVELVKNKETLEPVKLEIVNGILNDCLEMGVILVKGGIYGNVLRIKPPLCITKEDVDFTLHVIRRALDKNIK